MFGCLGWGNQNLGKFHLACAYNGQDLILDRKSPVFINPEDMRLSINFPHQTHVPGYLLKYVYIVWGPDNAPRFMSGRYSPRPSTFYSEVSTITCAFMNTFIWPDMRETPKGILCTDWLDLSHMVPMKPGVMSPSRARGLRLEWASDLSKHIQGAVRLQRRMGDEVSKS